MKILQIAASLDPSAGGVSEGVRRSVEAFKCLGHEVEVATLDDPGAPYLCGLPAPVHPQGRLIKKYGYTPKLSKWVEQNAHRFDAVILNSLWNHASVGGWQGLKRSGTPYYLFVHGMMDPWFRQASPLKHCAKQIFWTVIQGKVLRDAKAVLFTAEEERVRSRNVFWGYQYRDVVVGYGAVAPPDRKFQQVEAFYSSNPRLRDRRYLLFLGRIHSKKGCDLLIEAFSTIAALCPDVDLVIAGPDQVGLTARLQEQTRNAGVAERTHWTGMLQGDEKWGALRAAEAFVLPSHQENFGIAVAEALACGTPVLISDKVNIWREVAQLGAGLVYPDTTLGTQKAMTDFLTMGEAKRRTMRDSAQSSFDSHFDIKIAAKSLLNLIERDLHAGR